MESEKFKTLVWNPLHKVHQFEKAGVYPTYWGLLYMWKCIKCGELEIKIEKKSEFQRIRVVSTSVTIEKKV